MGIGYKLLRIKRYEDGSYRLFPLYVFANEETKIGAKLDAKNGPLTNSGRVRSRLGELSYRPGWHITTCPLANQIYCRKNGIKYQRPDTCWTEVWYSDEIDYTLVAHENGVNKKTGNFSAVKACLREIPVNGFYYYKTNPQAEVDWLIAGSIKILRVLSNEEVAELCRRNGVTPQPVLEV